MWIDKNTMPTFCWTSRFISCINLFLYLSLQIEAELYKMYDVYKNIVMVANALQVSLYWQACTGLIHFVYAQKTRDFV